MKTYIALTAVCFSLLCLESAAQLTNKGAQVTIANGAMVYTSWGVQNSSAGKITNNGSMVSDSFITNNSECIISGNGSYTIQGSWKNSGTFSAGTSKLIFFGKGNSDITTGGANLYDLQLNKNAKGMLNMKDASKVLHSIQFLATKNWVQLNKNILTLDTNCTITGYNDKKYFITNDTGLLRKVKVGNTKFTFPVGFNKSTYNPLSITESGTADNYSVRCLEQALLNGGSGSAITHGGIGVSWLIREGVAGGANATVEAQWDPSKGDQLPGFDSAKCMVVRYNGTAWDFNATLAGSASGTTTKTKKRNGVTAVGYFTILSTANPTLENSITAVNSDNLNQHNTPGVQVLVYPTIVQNSVNLSVTKKNENIQTMNITVVDGTGRTILRKEKINSQSQQISLPHLSSGIYLVLIEYGDYKYNQRIIVSQ